MIGIGRRRITRSGETSARLALRLRRYSVDVVKGSVVEAAAQRARGERVSRPKALLVATVVGVGAAVATYKLLRSGGEEERLGGLRRRRREARRAARSDAVGWLGRAGLAAQGICFGI